MNKSWYKRAIKDASNLNLGYNIEDMPALVKQDSDVLFQEINTINREDSKDILGVNGEVQQKTDDSSDMEWFRLGNMQNQLNLVPHISIAAVNQETEEAQVKRIEETFNKNIELEEKPDSANERVRKSSYQSQSSKVSRNEGGYLRKRTPIKRSRGSRKQSYSVDSMKENDQGQERLLKIMLGLFEGKEIRKKTIEPLRLDERQILSSLMIRKFGVNVKPDDDLEKMESLINNNKSNSKPKRLEENYKLVFKKALKYLLNQYKTTKHLRVRKPQLEQMFYDHYFKEVFESEGLADEFYLSSTRNKKPQGGQCLFNPKTINTRYVASIMKSKKFVNDFNDYLENEFMNDYSESRKYKITKVLEKCYDFLNKKKTGAMKVKEYIELNPKCKLPWSDLELTTAKESVYHLLNEKIKARSRKMSHISKSSK